MYIATELPITCSSRAAGPLCNWSNWLVQNQTSYTPYSQHHPVDLLCTLHSLSQHVADHGLTAQHFASACLGGDDVHGQDVARASWPPHASRTRSPREVESREIISLREKKRVFQFCRLKRPIHISDVRPKRSQYHQKLQAEPGQAAG